MSLMLAACPSRAPDRVRMQPDRDHAQRGSEGKWPTQATKLTREEPHGPASCSVSDRNSSSSPGRAADTASAKIPPPASSRLTELPDPPWTWMTPPATRRGPNGREELQGVMFLRRRHLDPHDLPGAPELVERPDGHEPPVVDDGHAVADALDLAQVMARQEDRGSLAREGSEQRAELPDPDGIEAVGRLVEQQEPRPPHELPRARAAGACPASTS